VVAAIVCLLGVPARGDSSRSATVAVGKAAAALFDADGNVVILPEARYHTVVTRSRNGNVLLKLFAKGIANDTGDAVHWSYANTGALCGVHVADENGGHVVLTRDWREVVSASGRAVLTCRLKLSK
jgi:hypothetical protein